MHKQIDKLALKAINKALKQHNCKVVLGQGSTARYLVQRSTVEARKVPVKGSATREVVGYKQVREQVPIQWGTEDRKVWYAIGVAYGEALLDLFKDDTLRTVNMGDNGWYDAPSFSNRNYMPVVLDAREMLQVELALS